MIRQRIAEKFKISAETLRYYEELGLINPKRNPKNGYRDYSETEEIKLGIIIRFKQFGFSLKEIKTFFELLSQNELQSEQTPKNRDFSFFIEKKISFIDDQIQGLNKVKKSLKKFQNKEDRETCAIYQKLIKPR